MRKCVQKWEHMQKTEKQANPSDALTRYITNIYMGISNERVEISDRNMQSVEKIRYMLGQDAFWRTQLLMPCRT